MRPFADFQKALSSANCDKSIPFVTIRWFIAVLSVSIMTLNKVGLSTTPCGDPLSVFW